MQKRKVMTMENKIFLQMYVVKFMQEGIFLSQYGKDLVCQYNR
jgi:hypothetical protein